MKTSHFTILLAVIALMTVAGVVFAGTIVRATVYDPLDSAVVSTSTAVTVHADAMAAGIIPSHASAAATAPQAMVPSPTPASATAQGPANYPSQVQIPSIGVNAHVQYVGTTAAGNIGTPNNFTDVAWYDESAVPGQSGVSIIDGHVDNGLGLAGVFKNLGKVAVGDKVSVVENDGTTKTYTVTSVTTYDYTDVPVSALLQDSGDASVLRLITCSGTWVPNDRTYDQRMVVTAVEEN